MIAETTNAIQQGAHRRGANMGMMSIEHPDIIKFIYAKRDITAFNNFNISVKITDVFMNRLHKNPDSAHIVTNPRTQKQYVIPKSIDLLSYRIQDLRPSDGDMKNCYTVGDIWKMIIANAHATGEPGVCFIDRVNEDNPTPALDEINATNPCGEQPLLDYEACNLGSLNVSKFVLSDGIHYSVVRDLKLFTKGSEVIYRISRNVDCARNHIFFLCTGVNNYVRQSSEIDSLDTS